MRSRLLLQVHDELVLEVFPGERDALEALVRAAMAGAADLSVPLDVSVGFGATLAGRRPLTAVGHRRGCGKPRIRPLGRAGSLGWFRVRETTRLRRDPYLMTISTTAAPAQVAINDIGSAEDFMAAIDATIKYFNDGDIVEGTVVKVDRDEVLLDIGYKTEGVIPSRELSIKHDVDPSQVVSVGDHVEALVLTKEDKEGRLILSKKRAQYERAWGTIERIKEEDGVVEGPSSRSSRAA